MKLTMEQLISVFEGLKRLANLTEDKNFKVPFNISFRVSKYLRMLAMEVEEFNKIRQRILEEYGTEEFVETETVDNDGNKLKKSTGSFTIPLQNREEFVQRLNELLQEATIKEGLIPFKVSELSDLTIDANTLVLLSPIINETE